MAQFGRQFQTIFDHAPIGMVMMDSAGRPLYSNLALQNMLGEDEYALRNDDLLNFVHADDREEFKKQFSALVRGETARVRTFGRYVRKGGTTAWWRVDVTHVFSAEHSPFIFGFMEDVTEQKADAERLRRAKEYAERATRTKSAFLANMTHEIRTPIHTITGMTELLLETALDDEQREYAQQVRFSAEVLLGLVNDILDFSKIEAGKLSLEKIPFDLFTMTEDAVDMVSLEAYKKGLEVVLYLDPELPDIVIGDPIRLRQIIVNLFNNAVKFTSRGEVLIRVELVERRGEQSTILFEIVDTGIGIPQDKLVTLFQAFSQVDSTTTRRFGGTGLGLSICRSLVKLMNGTIGVKSQETKGSTFWFLIPFEGQHAGAEGSRRLLPRFSEKSLLLIDDNTTFNTHTRRYLDRWFNRVDEVASGAEALKRLHESADAGKPYDVALVDLMLPGMDGWQLASEVNADKSINSTRLILMSPAGKASGEAKMKLLGWFNAYLNKPLKINELYNALANSLSSDLDLAAADDENTTAMSHAPKNAGIASAPETTQIGRILVAEDHLVNQELFRTILSRMGHTVKVASNGREALNLALAGNIDIIFMDVQMPEMNGYEASREIRKVGITVPIIAVTANAMKGERERCIKYGMDDYLTKPFKSADVLPLIAKWMVKNVPELTPAEPLIDEPTVLEALADELPIEESKNNINGGVFDYAGAVEAFMGKEDVVRRVVWDFVSRIAVQLEQMDVSLKAGDLGAASIEAHAIKGGAWNLEVKRLGDAAARLEAATREGRADDAMLDLQRVRGAFEEFRSFCEALPELNG
ncbi:MAG TPA: response regulator [Spirochaetia bacterium]|nr:response regulator [Spirochaetia bacterium]